MHRCDAEQFSLRTFRPDPPSGSRRSESIIIIADVTDCGYSVWLLERKYGVTCAIVGRVNLRVRASPFATVTIVRCRGGETGGCDTHCQHKAQHEADDGENQGRCNGLSCGCGGNEMVSRIAMSRSGFQISAATLPARTGRSFRADLAADCWPPGSGPIIDRITLTARSTSLRAGIVPTKIPVPGFDRRH